MTRFPEARGSCVYFPSRVGGQPEGHAYLLARDIPLGIMPMQRSSEQHPFRAELRPANDARAEWLQELIDIGQFRQHTLADAVSGFVETAAHYLGYHGEMYLEITGDRNGQAAKLAPLPPGRLSHLPRSYLQWVPKVDREPLDRGRFVSLSRECVWHLRLPQELGSPRAYRRLLRRLEALSNPTPEFALNSPKFDLGRSVGFDFSRLRAAYERETERATKRWGTISSFQRPVGDSTEYFFIARRLEFRRAQATLREHLLLELSRLLARLGIPEQLVIEGLIPPGDLRQALNGLHAGEISLADALQACGGS